MRHQRRSRRFDRTASHLKAMMRNMTSSLIEHERIVTTPQKAKECRRFAERLVTMARKGGLANYRRALALLDNETAVNKLFTEIAPRFADRPGGYTRILHLADVRLGDAARQCIFEFVEEKTAKRKSGSKGSKAAPKRAKRAPSAVAAEKAKRAAPRNSAGRSRR